MAMRHSGVFDITVGGLVPQVARSGILRRGRVRAGLREDGCTPLAHGWLYFARIVNVAGRVGDILYGG